MNDATAPQASPDWTKSPVLIKEVDDKTHSPLAPVENIQREDLNPLEEAQGLQRSNPRIRSHPRNLRPSHLVARAARYPIYCACSTSRNRCKPCSLAGDIEMGQRPRLTLARSTLAHKPAPRVKEIASRRPHRARRRKRGRSCSKARATNPAESIAAIPPAIILHLQERLSERPQRASREIKVGAKNQGNRIQFGNLDVLDGQLLPRWWEAGE